MNTEVLIPKDKHDISHINELHKLKDEEIQPVVGKLLEWLQDINWPVSRPVAEVLLKHENVIVPYVAEILNGDDYLWILWVMELIVKKLTIENKCVLKPDIENLLKMEIINEDCEEIVSVVQKVLNSIQ